MYLGKKLGNRAVVYLNEREQPTPVRDFDDEPIGAFPLVLTVQQALAAYPGIQLLEKPSTAAEGVVIEDSRIAEVAKDYKAPVQTASRQGADGKGLEAKILNEFERLCVAHGLASGKKQKEIARDIEAVGTFLLAVEPALEAELVAIKGRAGEQRRFKI